MEADKTHNATRICYYSIKWYDAFDVDHACSSSWWYLFCLKCRQKEIGPGWEPTYWSKACPHPFCPSFRHMARILALLITVGLFWGVVLVVAGQDAKPGGQLFNIAVLVVVAYLGGWLFRMLTLPALVGMLLVGVIFQNVGLINVEGTYQGFVSILRWAPPNDSKRTERFDFEPNRTQVNRNYLELEIPNYGI